MLFFKRRGAPQDLHPSPPRPSPDLTDLSRADIPYEPVSDVHLPGYQPTVEGNAKQIRQADVGDRSEEHTSELQSRQYLVCRLLLAKNKPSHYCRTLSYPRSATTRLF